MSWIAVPVAHEDVTPELLFELAKKHRLIPDNIVDAVDHYKGICENCALIELHEEDTNEHVGSVIISDIIDGESAQVDFIPRPQFFTVDKPFREEMDATMAPVFRKLLEGRNLRRLTALVPKSRSRTFKALKASGFKKEGVMRQAVKFQRKDAEDLVIMGMLASKE